MVSLLTVFKIVFTSFSRVHVFRDMSECIHTNTVTSTPNLGRLSSSPLMASLSTILHNVHFTWEQNQCVLKLRNDCLPLLHSAVKDQGCGQSPRREQSQGSGICIEGWTEPHCFAIFLFSQVPQSHFMSLHHDPCHRKTNRVIVLLKPGLKLRAQTQTRFLTQPKVATSLRSPYLSPFFSSTCLARSCCLHSKYHQLINQVTETCNSSFSDWRWQIMVINSSRREGSRPHYHM